MTDKTRTPSALTLQTRAYRAVISVRLRIAALDQRINAFSAKTKRQREELEKDLAAAQATLDQFTGDTMTSGGDVTISDD